MVILYNFKSRADFGYAWTQSAPNHHRKFQAELVFGGILPGPFGNSVIVNRTAQNARRLSGTSGRRAAQPIGLELEGHEDLNALLCAFSPWSP
jgi:hypothetical protein